MVVLLRFLFSCPFSFLSFSPKPGKPGSGRAINVSRWAFYLLPSYSPFLKNPFVRVKKSYMHDLDSDDPRSSPQSAT